MEQLVSIFDWIGSNEAILSGIAATIVIVGVLFTPLGRGLGALFSRRSQPRSASPPAPTASHAVESQGGTSGGAAPEHPPLVSDRPSIAVMPFANLSGDPEHEYLADGLTEDIIIGLSRVKHFFVIARNSTFTYKSAAVDVQQISRELGVRYVLEGSVRKLGDRIRVTAQLVDATTRGHTWAEQFDRKLSEILDVDDEVTEAIVAALQPALRLAEAEQARRAGPGDLNAWALVNRAWVSVQSDLGSVETARSAIRACEEALALDSEYGFAHAVLGHALSLLARRSDQQTEGEESLASIRRALALAPDDPLVHHCHAALLGNLGRTQDAVRAWERALHLDPNSAGARAGLGIAQIYLKQPGQAVGNIDAALRLSPRDPLAYHWLAHRALALVVLGRWGEALEAGQESVQRTGSDVGYASLAAALANQGRLEEARKAYAELESRLPELVSDDLARMARSVAPDDDIADQIDDALRLAAGH